MTAGDVITDRARRILNDPSSTRWTDAVLIDFLNDGVQYISDMRPDSLLTASYTLGTVTDVTVIGNTVSIGDRYREALAHFVASRAFATEGKNRRDLARADASAKQFAFLSGLPQPRMLTPDRRG